MGGTEEDGLGIWGHGVVRFVQVQAGSKEGSECFAMVGEWNLWKGFIQQKKNGRQKGGGWGRQRPVSNEHLSQYLRITILLYRVVHDFSISTREAEVDRGRQISVG